MEALDILVEMVVWMGMADKMEIVTGVKVEVVLDGTLMVPSPIV